MRRPSTSSPAPIGNIPRILIVDDEVQNRALVGGLAEREQVLAVHGRLDQDPWMAATPAAGGADGRVPDGDAWR